MTITADPTLKYFNKTVGSLVVMPRASKLELRAEIKLTEQNIIQNTLQLTYAQFLLYTKKNKTKQYFE